VIEDFKKEFVAKNNREPTDKEIKGGLVKVVRDEVLASLKNMVKYQTSGPKLLLITYENELITDALENQRVDKKKDLKRDIKQLPENVQEEINKKVKEKKNELTQTEAGKAQIQKNFDREIKKQIEVYDSAAKEADNQAIVKQVSKDIKKLETDLKKLKKQQAFADIIKIKV